MEKNNNRSKDLIKELHHCTNRKNRISINWIAKKNNTPLFPLKVENINLISKICHGL